MERYIDIQRSVNDIFIETKQNENIHLRYKIDIDKFESELDAYKHIVRIIYDGMMDIESKQMSYMDFDFKPNYKIGTVKTGTVSYFGCKFYTPRYGLPIMCAITNVNNECEIELILYNEKH